MSNKQECFLIDLIGKENVQDVKVGLIDLSAFLSTEESMAYVELKD